MQLLLDNGAEVDHQDRDGWTALMGASRRGHVGIVQTLLAEGAEINHQDNEGWTALYLASQAGREGVVRAVRSWP